MRPRLRIPVQVVESSEVDFLGPGEIPVWLWAIYAAIVLVGCLLLVAAYRAGERRARDLRRNQAPPPPGTESCREAVTGLIQAYDLAHQSPALRAHIQQALQRAGVEMVIVRPGDPFDAAVQHVVDTQATTDPPLVNTVVQIVRPGWRDSAGLIRTAEVSVWTS